MSACIFKSAFSMHFQTGANSKRKTQEGNIDIPGNTPAAMTLARTGFQTGLSNVFNS
jgi:hypothetical protein